MIPTKRKDAVLDYLRKHRSATVAELSRAVFASEATVRRDVDRLVSEGLCEKVYGGVLLAEHKTGVVPLALRDNDHSSAKEKLAADAAAMIPDGATVMLDASSTTRRILRYLPAGKRLTVLTNNLKICEESESLPNVRTYCCGGLYLPQNHVFVGPAAEKFLRSVHADLCFFSSQGISEEGLISDASEEETSVRRVMLGASDRSVFLCDDSKIGVIRPFILCGKDEVSQILCPVRLPWEK